MSNATEATVIQIPWLCGPERAFWDTDLSWDTDNPGITDCFRKSFWTFPPFVTFWLLFPLELRKLFRSEARGIPVTGLNIGRILAAGMMALIAAIDLVYWALDKEFTPIDLIDPCLRLILSVTVLALIHFERQRGVQVSSFQCLFFAVFTITSILCSYGTVWDLIHKGDLDAGDLTESLPHYTFLITVAFIFMSFLLHFFVDATPEYRGPKAEATNDNMCPSHTSSFPSTVTFAWFTPLAWKGFKRPLAVEDLWDLAPQVASRNVVPRFERHWDESMSKAAVYAAEMKKKAPEEVTFKKDEDQVQVVSGKKSDKKDSTSSSTPIVSVLPSLIKAFGLSFITGSILKLVQDILIFVPPMLLKLIIQFSSSDEPMWRGIMFAALLLATGSLQTLMLSVYFYQMYKIGLWTRSALISALYRKSLRVSKSAKKEITTGEVVNLMSVDVQRLMDMLPYINMVWSSPMQIFVCVFFLWQQLGPSVLAGLAVMILMIPIQGGIAAKSRSYQMQQMKEKDQRVKMMNEILQGIKILKLYAWEPSFEKLVRGIRDNEISILTRMGYLQAGSAFIWTCAPFLVSLVTFATYVLSSPENVLDSEKAFVALALFNILRFPLSMLPMMIAGLVQASVSVKRINKYMNCDELKEEDAGSAENGADGAVQSAIVVEKASFAWDTESEKPTLQNISLDVKKNSLVAVVGSVGSGKSSLVASLLGELERTEGSLKVRGKVAYVAQQAWIQNATVKYNILFGRPFESEKYEKVLKACALESDLKMLPAGDETEIGEKGINLSGGQKQRVSLARACYSDSDIFLLDDPLSAVDAHVGKHIFQEVISENGLLGDKTRVLITHGVTYLPKMDDIVVLKEGVISETGTYQELLDKKGDFAEFLVQYLNDDNDAEEADELKNLLEETMGKEELQAKLMRARSVSESQHQTDSVHSSQADLTNGEGVRSRTISESPTKNVARQRSIVSASGSNVASPKTANGVDKKQKKQENGDLKKQYQEEKNEKGNVTWAVYTYYIINMGVLMFGSCILCYAIYQICAVFSSVWLSHWSDSNTVGLKNATDAGTNYTENANDRDLYLGIYGAFGAGQAIAAVVGSLFLYLSTLQGSRRLHHHMLSNVLRSPMSFFDTTPQGRILNRFSKDVDVLDVGMPMILRGWITCLLAVLSTFAVISYTTPIFLAPIILILLGYYIVQRIYVATSRELKRLESISRSPIFSHFGETVNGVQTIRAYSLQKQFISESERKVDINQQAAFPGIVANRWLAVRLETVGNFIIFCAALFAVLGRETLSPGMVGLSVSYALSVTQTLNWLVRMTSEFETNIVAAERMKEYSETPAESDWRMEEKKPKKEWPEEGRIEFKNYSTRYRAGLDLVLNDISFTVGGGERVGIVGRTGAGKSSLTLALFRMVEPASGQIVIDDIDLSTIGLHDLREKLTIIPQDPVLFSGSLRLNLDPFDKYTDEQIWRALEHAHLKDFIEKTLTDGLAHVVAEGGENLSVGQRQLICLGRALLRKTKVLILDEATAAVDMETDDLIQATIKEEFKGCTVITIAHRLNTIVDYDKILVLDAGKIAEFDAPKTLLSNKQTIFYGMCKEAGLAS